MKEIAPGIFHWSTMHPKIKFEVSSYLFADEAVVLDPMAPPEGWQTLPGSPKHVVLTNRHHYRDSAEFTERFGCTVWCVDKGLHEFKAGEKVEPFKHGETLPGGFVALEIGVLCPDETALYHPRAGGVIACADGVVRMGDGPLGFVPDAYLGDDPATVKAGLRGAYGRLLDREFEHLLLAHGVPLSGNARSALAGFVGAET